MESDRETIAIDIGRKINVADLRRALPVNPCCESVLKHENRQGDRKWLERLVRDGYSKITRWKVATLLLLRGSMLTDNTSYFANRRSFIIARAKVTFLLQH